MCQQTRLLLQTTYTKIPFLIDNHIRNQFLVSDQLTFNKLINVAITSNLRYKVDDLPMMTINLTIQEIRTQPRCATKANLRLYSSHYKYKPEEGFRFLRQFAWKSYYYTYNGARYKYMIEEFLRSKLNVNGIYSQQNRVTAYVTTKNIYSIETKREILEILY